MNRIAVLCIVVIPQLEEKEPFRECEEEMERKIKVKGNGIGENDMRRLLEANKFITRNHKVLTIRGLGWAGLGGEGREGVCGWVWEWTGGGIMKFCMGYCIKY